MVKWAVTTPTLQASFMHFKHLFAPLLLAGIASAAPANIENRESCSAVQLVHAAGTTESGLGLVGTPLAKEFASVVPGTTSYAIPYDTSTEYVASVGEGARMTEQYLAAQSARCPDQRFILSGYSKGAMVMHKTNLSSDLKSKPIDSPSVNSSPRNRHSSTQNVASFCNSGDEFCDTAGARFGPHLAYSSDGSIEVAANFAKERA